MSRSKGRDRLGFSAEGVSEDQTEDPDLKTEKQKSQGRMDCPDHKEGIIEPVKGDGPDEPDQKPIPFALNLCLRKIITQDGREGDMPQVRENGPQKSHKNSKPKHIPHILCGCETQSS